MRALTLAALRRTTRSLARSLAHSPRWRAIQAGYFASSFVERIASDEPPEVTRDRHKTMRMAAVALPPRPPAHSIPGYGLAMALLVPCPMWHAY